METPPPRGKYLAQRSVSFLMARKKPWGKQRGRLLVPRINSELNLGTLALNTLLSTTPGSSPGQEAFLISTDLTITLVGLTAGEGPIIVGLAHEDYSDAEIEECIEATNTWQQHDQIAQEQARRKVRTIGAFHADGSLNDGKPIRTKCRWQNGEDDTLKMWAYNKGASPLTTGAQIEWFGSAFLRGN